MFITVDGPDGAGKTTVLRLLHDRLAPTCPVHMTAEPTRTPLGAEIRRILQKGSPGEEQTLTELFLRDRAAHVRDEILPRLAEGKLVLCDRYKYSTLVYQQLQGESRDRLIEGNRDFPAPDIAFILTVADPSPLLERISARGEGRELFETKAVLEKTIKLYAQMQECFPSENIRFLDAAQPPERVTDEMFAAILEIARPA